MTDDGVIHDHWYRPLRLGLCGYYEIRWQPPLVPRILLLLLLPLVVDTVPGCAPHLVQARTFKFPVAPSFFSLSMTHQYSTTASQTWHSDLKVPVPASFFRGRHEVRPAVGILAEGGVVALGSIGLIFVGAIVKCVWVQRGFRSRPRHIGSMSRVAAVRHGACRLERKEESGTPSLFSPSAGPRTFWEVKARLVWLAVASVAACVRGTGLRDARPVIKC
jgi:hypothetical protein